MARTFVWHPRRGPAKTEKQNLPDSGNVRIKQGRSGIGHSACMRATLEAIGLKHHQDVIEKPITSGLRGQLKQVRHLVEVTVIDGQGAGKAKPKTKRAKATSEAGETK